jgi:hypothetical protein
MIIRELLKKLQTYNQNLEVAFEWDGGLSNPQSFEVEYDKNSGETVLVIDVSEYGTWDYDHEKE